MRKCMYLLAVAAFGFAACTSQSYKITGTMEDAVDGDTVYMMKRVDRQFVPIDTAIITKGEFVFTGVQDTAVSRYLAYMGADDLQPAYIDLFVENGNIHVQMVKAIGGDVVSGSPLNDEYQTFKNKIHQSGIEQNSLRKSLQSATEEEKADLMKKVEAVDDELSLTVRSTIEKNVSNPLGLHLIGSFYYYFDYNVLGEILSQLPERYQSDATVVRLNALVETGKATGVGQNFIDFEMKDPEGNSVKLSDYVGKGKLVLVDFWASWCGPCREEMPKLVEAYARYQDKNFEIVGVSLDRTEKAWKEGIEQLGMTWPQMSDLEYWNSKGAKLYAVSSIPHVVLIDGDGVIVARGLHGEKLHAKLAELLDR